MMTNLQTANRVYETVSFHVYRYAAMVLLAPTILMGTPVKRTWTLHKSLRYMVQLGYISYKTDYYLVHEAKGQGHLLVSIIRCKQQLKMFKYPSKLITGTLSTYPPLLCQVANFFLQCSDIISYIMCLYIDIKILLKSIACCVQYVGSTYNVSVVLKLVLQAIPIPQKKGRVNCI